MASLRLHQAARWIVAVTLVGCADRVTAPVPITKQPAALATIRCEADVRLGAVSCADADTTNTAHISASVRLGAGAMADLMVGGQNVYVTLTSSNVTYSSNIFGFDVTVKNLIPQALGTTDGTTTDANGVRVFFSAAPSTTGGSGTVTVNNADGTATFTASNQSYFQYSTKLAQNATSGSKHWQLNVPATVTSFQFVVYVDAAVQYPNGWIDVSPANDTVSPGGTATLSGTVRDAVGRTLTGHTLTWSSSATSVATINSSTGVASAVNPGTTTMSVTDGTVSGSTPFVTRNTPATLQAQTIHYPGNIAISVDSAHGFMAGLTDPDASQNHTLTSPTGTSTLGSGATLTVSTNGSFTYTPAAGQTSTDSIPYTVSDGIQTSTSYAKVSLSGGMHWYVDNTAGGVGATGTQAHPYTSLASLTGHTSSNDTIFVNAGSGNTTAGYTMQTGETLLGQAALVSNLTVSMNGATITEFSTGGTPHLVAASGTALTLGSGNTIKGAYIGATSGTAISGTSFGTLTLSADTVVAAGGPSLSLTTGSIANGSAILFAKSSGSSSYGLTLSAVSGGTLTISADTILSPTTAGVRITGGSVSLTTSTGAITTTTGGAKPVDINSNTGGTLSLAETITANAATQSGLSFATNTGATITLSGNMTVITGANAAFSATGGGTINVTGTTNTLTTTTGTALNVTSTTIGASGITFKSISSNGAANGIVLSGTGSSGGLTVTGDGIPDPTNTTQGRTTVKQGGGSVTLGSGGTIQNSTGVGVSLANTNNVVLRNLTLSGGGGATVGAVGSGNDAIQANTVSGLTLANVLVSGDTANMGFYGTGVSSLYMDHVDIEGNAYSKTDSALHNSHGTWNVRLDNPTGTDSVQNSLFQNASVTVFGVSQAASSGSATFKVKNSKFATTLSSASLGAGFEFLHTNAVSQTLSIANSTFSGSTGTFDNGIYYSGTTSSGGGTLTISGNTLNNDQSEIWVQYAGLSHTLNYTISSNLIRQSTSGAGAGITVELLSGSNSGSLLSGTISSNSVGSASVQGSSGGGTGIQTRSEGAGTLSTTVSNNTVKNLNGNFAFDLVATGTTHANLKWRGNDFEVVQTVNGYAGARLDVGIGSDSPLACIDIGTGKLNTEFLGSSASGAWGIDFEVGGLSGTPVVNLYGYTGHSVANSTDYGTYESTIEDFLDTAATTVSPPSNSGGFLWQAGTVQGTATACSTP